MQLKDVFTKHGGEPHLTITAPLSQWLSLLNVTDFESTYNGSIFALIKEMNAIVTEPPDERKE